MTELFLCTSKMFVKFQKPNCIPRWLIRTIFSSQTSYFMSAHRDTLQPIETWCVFRWIAKNKSIMMNIVISFHSSLILDAIGKTFFFQNFLQFTTKIQNLFMYFVRVKIQLNSHEQFTLFKLCAKLLLNGMKTLCKQRHRKAIRICPLHQGINSTNILRKHGIYMYVCMLWINCVCFGEFWSKRMENAKLVCVIRKFLCTHVNVWRTISTVCKLMCANIW